MLSMVLVNNPGTWSSVYPPLLHAEWHGCTFTDLIFPFFLFIVGVSMAFSFAKRLEQAGSRVPLIIQIVKRTIVIFALGLFLSWFGYFNIFEWSISDAPQRIIEALQRILAEGRIPGVLQRIAICYFFVSWMAMGLSPRAQWATGFGLLAVYWIGMLFVPVPGYGAGVWEPMGNFGWRVDNLLLFGRTWSHAPAEGFDPEGVWSTLPAIVTTLLGYFTGTWLRTDRDRKEKLIGLFVGGFVCLLLGYALTIWMPYNKNLWTVPYMFHTAGFALQVLAMLYWIADIHGYQRWLKPGLIVGSNAITVYVGCGILARLLWMIKIGEGDAQVSLKAWIVENLLNSWASPMNASLMYGLSYSLLWLGIAAILYRLRIFIKI